MILASCAEAGLASVKKMGVHFLWHNFIMSLVFHGSVVYPISEESPWKIMKNWPITGPRSLCIETLSLQ
jgi:hypothetical protein